MANKRLPNWTALDERNLRQLMERKEERARMLSQRVEEVADKIIVHNMSSMELAKELVENANAVTKAVRPFLTGPFSAMVIPVGTVLKGDAKAERQFIRTGLKGWDHKSILDALDADGWVPREFFDERTPDECDEQGNALFFHETLRIDANVATVRCNKETPPGYLMVVRIPEGEEDF